jgi:hypothetical protein
LFSNPKEIAADVKMLKRAVVQRWTVRNGMRKEACERLRRILNCESLDPETHIAAIKALGYLDLINVRREQGPAQQNLNLSLGVDLAGQVERMLHNDDYMRFLESRDASRSDQSRPVCPSGDAGPVHATGTHHGYLKGHTGNGGNGKPHGQNGNGSN